MKDFPLRHFSPLEVRQRCSCRCDLEKTRPHLTDLSGRESKHLSSLPSGSNGPDSVADLSAASLSATGTAGCGDLKEPPRVTGPLWANRLGTSPSCGPRGPCCRGKNGTCTGGWGCAVCPRIPTPQPAKSRSGPQEDRGSYQALKVRWPGVWRLMQHPHLFRPLNVQSDFRPSPEWFRMTEVCRLPGHPSPFHLSFPP